jgi:hypothetical protein
MAFYCVTCQGLALVLDTGEVSCGRPTRVGRWFLEGDPAAYQED